jgi:ubiquitin C-terminal hydrolase
MVPYDLFATINHSGTLDKGHYIANVLKGDHWYSINDEFVDNANEVLSNGDAYMLFYSRRI